LPFYLALHPEFSCPHLTSPVGSGFNLNIRIEFEYVSSVNRREKYSSVQLGGDLSLRIIAEACQPGSARDDPAGRYHDFGWNFFTQRYFFRFHELQ
jgi:hypothetical protein